MAAVTSNNTPTTTELATATPAPSAKNPTGAGSHGAQGGGASSPGVNTASSDHVSMTINSKSKAPSIATSYGVPMTPAPGNIFAIYSVTISDLNQNGILVNPNYFKLTTSDGSAYQYSSNTFALSTPFNSVSNVQPGEKVTGSIAFEIPQSKSPATLTYNDEIFGNQVKVNV
jgi:hypothetical protein